MIEKARLPNQPVVADFAPNKHPDTLTSMNNLAYTMHEQGEREPALRLFRFCLIGLRKVLGEITPIPSK